jgi:hypothetical protein
MDPTESANDKQDVDLYYGLRLLIIKLRALKFKICIADTNFSIFDVIKVSASSPIRDQVTKFSDLQKITLEEIRNYLANLFDVDFNEVPEELLTELKMLQGRPKFSSHF